MNRKKIHLQTISLIAGVFFLGFIPFPGLSITNADTAVIAQSLLSIQSINPSSVAEGTASFSLVVTGADFESGSIVQINGTARPTIYNSPSQLTATIYSYDVAQAGISNITVLNPDRTVSNSLPLTITNPIPNISIWIPETMDLASSNLTLTVNGIGYLPTSEIFFGSLALPTTYISPEQLSTTIPTGVALGSYSITVVNPSPGGGTSNSVILTIINTNQTTTGSIQIIAIPIGGNATFPFTSNFGVSSISTTSGLNSQTVSGLIPGNTTYAISGQAPQGWVFNSVTCNNETVMNPLNSQYGYVPDINVVAGETTACSFTYTATSSATYGCTNSLAANYNSAATINNGSCIITGCTNPAAVNYNPTANTDDGSCFMIVAPSQTNYPGDIIKPFNITVTDMNGNIIQNPALGLDSCGLLQSCGHSIIFSPSNGQLTVSGSVENAEAPGTYTLIVNTTGGATKSFTWTILAPGSTNCTDPTATNYNLNNGSCVYSNSTTTTITINNIIIPSSDPGLFSLRIDGTPVSPSGYNIGNGASTGRITVTPGSHTVDAIAGNNTYLGDYIQTFSGDCDSSGNITLSAGENKVCTITETKKPILNITLIINPSSDQGSFSVLLDGSQTVLGGSVGGGSGGGSQAYVTTGSHSLMEVAGAGTNLSNYTKAFVCFYGDGIAAGTVEPNGVTGLNFNPGDDISCTFTNTNISSNSQSATLTVKKVLVPSSDLGTFDLRITPNPNNNFAYAYNVGNGGTTGPISLPSGSYNVSEYPGASYSPSSFLSGYIQTFSGDCDSSGNITLSAGDNKVCIITNTKISTAGTTITNCTDPTATNYNFKNGPCVYSNSSTTGSIEIIKNSTGGVGTETFNFTDNFSVPSVPTSNGAGSKISPQLAPGSNYNVSENNLPTGWTQTSASCSNGTLNNVVVVAGQTTICTFNNSFNSTSGQGTLLINKNAIGGIGTFYYNAVSIPLTPVASTITASIPNGTAASGAKQFKGSSQLSLTAGVYNLSEVLPSGWNLTNATCSNGNPTSFTITAGQTTTCTFTNTLGGTPTATLNIIKQTIGGNGTFNYNVYPNSSSTSSTPMDTFSINTAPSGTGSNQITIPVGQPLPYIQEQPLTGWSLTGLTCVDGNGNPVCTPSTDASTGAVSCISPQTITSGESVTCTFVNTSTPSTATLTIIKKTNTPGNFQFSIPNTPNPSFTLYPSLISATPLQDETTITGITPGNYYITESPNSTPGWMLASATCSDGKGIPSGNSIGSIALAGGDNITCTFTNNYSLTTGTIKVTVNTTNGNGTFPFSSNFGVDSITTTGNNTNGSGTQSVSALTPGSDYNIVPVNMPTGWNVTGSCNNGSGSLTTVAVVAGQTTTCTFNANFVATNTQGTLVINKNTTGGDGTFTYNVGSPQSAWAQGTTITTVNGQGTSKMTVSPGNSTTFNVSETNLPTGWTQTSASCSNGTPSGFTITAGQTTTCTFANTYSGNSNPTSTKNPTITTNLSSSSIATGAATYDTATLSGATANAGGNVTYSIFQDANCDTPTFYESGGEENVTNGIIGASNSIAFPSAGTYYWEAYYSGDANNNPAQSACSSEPLIVTSLTGTSTGTSTDTGTATLNIIKQTIGGNGTFNYNVYPNSSSTSSTPMDTFSINTAPSGTGSNQITIPVGQPLPYIQEQPLTGWSLTGLTCVDGNGNPVCTPSTDASTGAVSCISPQTITSGESVTCTFVNTFSTASTCSAAPAAYIYVFGVAPQPDQQDNAGEPPINQEVGNGVSFYKNSSYVDLPANTIGQEWATDPNNPTANHQYAGIDKLLSSIGKTQTQSAGKDTLVQFRGSYLMINYYQNENGNQECILDTSSTDLTQETENTSYSQSASYIFPTH